MSLSSLPLAKEVLGMSPVDEDWLQDCKTCGSPFGDFIVLASNKCAVFYVRKFDGEENVYFKLAKTYYADPEVKEVSSISYLPVKAGSGKSHDIWHCVIIGFTSGWVHFVSGDGQLLIAKQFICDKPVIKIRMLNGLPAKRARYPALNVPKLSELLIVYEATIVSIDNNILMNSLVTNRVEAAKTRGSFASLGNLPARKWKVRDQEKINDVAAFAEFNITYNQLYKVSMNKQLLNEDHLKSLGYTVSYLSAGSGPFLQQNSPHPLLPNNFTELAHNVVST